MKIQSLGEFCETGSGGTPLRSNPAFYKNGTIPWIKSGELKQRVVTGGEESITEKAIQESSAKIVKPGAVLVAMYGATVGQVSILGTKAATNQAICHIQPDQSICDSEYLYWVLISAKDRLVSLSVGGGQPNISQKILRNFVIPLPPLAEQKRIAKILDAADALRAKRRESIALLDTFLQSTFLKMFGDPVTNPMGWDVGRVGDMLSSVKYGTSQKANEHGVGYPVLRMNNITYEGGWDLSSLKHVELDPKEAEKYLVQTGAILFNRTNSSALVGKTAVYRSTEPMAFAGYLVRGIVNDRADPEYIGAFMNTSATKTYLKSKCKSIVGMANINAKEFQAIPVPIPPVSLQQRFSAVVGRTLSHKNIQRNHEFNCNQLFFVLQQRAFNGEL